MRCAVFCFLLQCCLFSPVPVFLSLYFPSFARHCECHSIDSGAVCVLFTNTLLLSVSIWIEMELYTYVRILVAVGILTAFSCKKKRTYRRRRHWQIIIDFCHPISRCIYDKSDTLRSIIFRINALHDCAVFNYRPLNKIFWKQYTFVFDPFRCIVCV